jgi:hypothetical protein
MNLCPTPLTSKVLMPAASRFRVYGGSLRSDFSLRRGEGLKYRLKIMHLKPFSFYGRGLESGSFPGSFCSLPPLISICNTRLKNKKILAPNNTSIKLARAAKGEKINKIKRKKTTILISVLFIFLYLA